MAQGGLAGRVSVPLLVRDPSTRELLRSPAVSATVLLAVSALCAVFAWSCARWEHVEPFVALPIRLGGWVLLGWVVLVGAAGLTAVVRHRSDERAAYVVTWGALVLLAMPTGLLWLARFTA